MNSPRGLPARAAEIYREHGSKVLVRKAFGFPKSIVLHRGLTFVTREELKRYAADRGRLWQEEAEQPCTIPPCGVAELDRFAGVYEPEPRFLCALSDCRLIGPGAVGLLDGRGIVLDTAGSHREYFFADYEDFVGSEVPELLGRKFLPGSRSAPSIARSPVLPLVPFYDNYYYPWLVEYLPKLRMAGRYEAETGRKPTLLIERDAPSFVHETLELLGYGDRHVEWDGSERRVEQLLVTNHRLTTSWAGPRYGFDLSAEDCLWVREAVRLAVDAVSSSNDSADGKRLHISRQETDRGRRVENYHEIESVLESRGFDSYVFESLSFPEQVRLVSDADVIVAPHGAGLANMLFADEPLIVELFPDTHIRPSYYLLSQLLDFEYEPIITEASEYDPHDDLFVDPDELTDRLNTLDPST